MLPPYLVFGAIGGVLTFPMQGRRPVCVSRAEFEGCCCGVDWDFFSPRLDAGEEYGAWDLLSSQP